MHFFLLFNQLKMRSHLCAFEMNVFFFIVKWLGFFLCRGCFKSEIVMGFTIMHFCAQGLDFLNTMDLTKKN